MAELVAAIRKVLRGERVIDPDLAAAALAATLPARFPVEAQPTVR